MNDAPTNPLRATILRPETSPPRIAAVTGGCVRDDGQTIELSVVADGGAVHELSFAPDAAASCRAILADLIGEARTRRGPAPDATIGADSRTTGSTRFPSAW
jgi:hypothetical protein